MGPELTDLQLPTGQHRDEREGELIDEAEVLDGLPREDPQARWSGHDAHEKESGEPRQSRARGQSPRQVRDKEHEADQDRDPGGSEIRGARSGGKVGEREQEE